MRIQKNAIIFVIDFLRKYHILSFDFRYLLDNPSLIRGKTVLDIGSGCGATAIAASVCGAHVVANDICTG